MRIISLFSLLSLLIFCLITVSPPVSSSSPSPSDLQSQLADSPVHHLNSTTLSPFIRSHTHLLLHFCDFFLPVCADSIPKFISASRLLHSESVNVTYAYFDCKPKSTEEHYCRALNSFIYPAYLFFRHGQKEPFQGDSSELSLIEQSKRIISSSYQAYETPVVELNDKNFQEKLSDKKAALVVFTALWCVECKKLERELEVAGKWIQNKLKEKKPNQQTAASVMIARVDGLANIQLTQSEGVQTYPHFFLYRHGKQYPYHGPKKNGTEIAQFMWDMATQPATTLLSNRAEFDSFTQHSTSVILLLGELDVLTMDPTAMQQYSRIYQGYELYAQLNRHRYRFAHILSKSLISVLQASPSAAITAPSLPSLIVYHATPYRKNAASKDQKLMPDQHKPVHFLANQPNYTAIVPDVFETSEGIATLDQFLHRYRFPLIPFVSIRQQDDFPRPLMLIFMEFEFDSSRNPIFSEEIHYWRNQFLAVQWKFPNIQFGLASALQFQQELMKFRLEITGEFGVGIYGIGGEKYTMDSRVYTLNAAGLERFLYDFVALKVPEVHQSQRVQPYSGPASGAFRIVLDNFHREVIDHTSTDQILYIYSGYCEYCLETVEKVINSLAKELSGESNLRFLQINGDLNDISRFTAFTSQYTEYPAVFYVRAAASEKERPWLFRGTIARDNLLNWIKQAASLPMKFRSPEEMISEKRKLAEEREKQASKGKEEL